MRLPQLSVLCLHGYSQDGHVLSRQMRRVTKHLEQRARFTFIDAPFSVPSLPDPSKQGFSWWLPSRNSEGQWEFEGVDEALRTLSEADAAEKRTHGAGFDGVLGFSQGGALASLSVGLLQVQGEKGRQSDEAIPQSAEAIPPPPPPLGSLRLAIFCGAFPYSAARPNFERVMRAPLSLSSVHCIGARDEIVKPAKSKQLEAKKKLFSSQSSIFAHLSYAHFFVYITGMLFFFITGMPFLITGTFLYHRHASFSGALSGGRARRARTCRGTRGAVRYERMFRDPLPTFKTHVDPPQASFPPDPPPPPPPPPHPPCLTQGRRLSRAWTDSWRGINATRWPIWRASSATARIVNIYVYIYIYVEVGDRSSVGA